MATAGRNILFVLLGVVALVLKSQYSGPLTETVHSYLGNVAASFAVYFMLLQQAGRLGVGRLPVAAVALVVVGAFEAFDGFGVMTNVYDPVDFAANAAGIGLAVAIDITLGRSSTQRKARHDAGHEST